MRVALARAIAVLMAIGIAAAACGGDPADPAATTPPPSSAPASPPAAASPSPSGAEAQVEFCSHLNAFAGTAGPAFDIGAIALIDGETPNERENVVTFIDSIASHGGYLQGRLPAELADDARTVVVAAKEARKKLAAGAPANDAVELLRTQKVKAAREAVVAYRGSC
jgi:hypothetical protein